MNLLRSLFVSAPASRGVVGSNPAGRATIQRVTVPKKEALSHRTSTVPFGVASQRFYPRGSLVLVDELATNEPGSVTKGMGYTVPVLAERIREFCAPWQVRPDGVADDAIFAKGGHSRGSVSDEFRAAGVTFYPAKKADRVSGWQVMRRLLQDAGKPDVLGLYVARHCEYFWQTVPYLGRDPKRIEDVDSRGPDHAVDAVRYGCLREAQDVLRVRLVGV